MLGARQVQSLAQRFKQRFLWWTRHTHLLAIYVEGNQDLRRFSHLNKFPVAVIHRVRAVPPSLTRADSTAPRVRPCQRGTKSSARSFKNKVKLPSGSHITSYSFGTNTVVVACSINAGPST